MSDSTVQSRPLVSILFSFRNEAEVIPELLKRLGHVLGETTTALASGSGQQRPPRTPASLGEGAPRAGMPVLPVDFEFIFVNDASTDESLEILTEAAKTDRRVKVLNMS